MLQPLNAARVLPICTPPWWFTRQMASPPAASCPPMMAVAGMLAPVVGCQVAPAGRETATSYCATATSLPPQPMLQPLNSRRVLPGCTPLSWPYLARHRNSGWPFASLPAATAVGGIFPPLVAAQVIGDGACANAATEPRRPSAAVTARTNFCMIKNPFHSMLEVAGLP